MGRNGEVENAAKLRVPTERAWQIKTKASESPPPTAWQGRGEPGTAVEDGYRRRLLVTCSFLRRQSSLLPLQSE